MCHIFSCSSWPFAPPIMPVGCPGRGHIANSQSRSPPETGERHHTSVRNPRPTLFGWAWNRAPMSAWAVAVIPPASPSWNDSIFLRRFALTLLLTAEESNFTVGIVDDAWGKDGEWFLLTSGALFLLCNRRETTTYSFPLEPALLCCALYLLSTCPDLINGSKRDQV